MSEAMCFEVNYGNVTPPFEMLMYRALQKLALTVLLRRLQHTRVIVKK